MTANKPQAGRPKDAPRRIPLWAWELEAWQRTGRKGPRPAGAPRLVPGWFWAWRAWGLRRARKHGSRQIRHHIAHPPTPTKPPEHPKKKPPTVRQRIVSWGRWGAEHEPDIHYTEDEHRDDWMTKPRGTLPLDTDCSGKATLNCKWGDAPDPNGLAYRYLGFTGTILDTAYKHGHVFEDVAKALPGDRIVIGPGTGWHVVTVLTAGDDPMVESHGSEGGPKIQRLSVDTREPKRVCQLLPAA